MILGASAGKEWTTAGIEPTYSTGDTFAWLIDGRIELEDETGVPVAAWTEFVPASSKRQRPLLGTFHLSRRGAGGFQVWELAEPSADGRTIATPLDRDLARRFVPYSEYPGNSRDPGGVSPVLRALHEAAQESGRAEDDLERQRRAADPLIDVLDQIKEAAADDARDRLHELVTGLARGDVDELLVRLALDYDELAEQIFEYDEGDERWKPVNP